MRKANLVGRIKALEETRRGTEACTFGRHRDLLLEILRRRAVPLPPLQGVDLQRTAELWAAQGTQEGRTFVMRTGELVAGEELALLQRTT